MGGSIRCSYASLKFLLNMGIVITFQVTIGETDCMIESMTETQILCRTIAQSEDGPSYMESRKVICLYNNIASTLESVHIII